MAWMNNDGLLIKYGPEEALVGGGGEFEWDGPNAVVAIDIRWNMLAAFGTRTILDETIRIPDGLLLRSASFQTIVPFTSSGSATLDLGFYKMDRTTQYDADGIDVAIALTAIDAVGETVACDGALVGTILASGQPSLISATVGTANYTAGRGVLTLTFFKPTRAPTRTGVIA